jgi:hypothetical protein
MRRRKREERLQQRRRRGGGQICWMYCERVDLEREMAVGGDLERVVCLNPLSVELWGCGLERRGRRDFSCVPVGYSGVKQVEKEAQMPCGRTGLAMEAGVFTHSKQLNRLSSMGRVDTAKQAVLPRSNAKLLDILDSRYLSNARPKSYTHTKCSRKLEIQYQKTISESTIPTTESTYCEYTHYGPHTLQYSQSLTH